MAPPSKVDDKLCSSFLQSALASRTHPPGQTIGNVRGIAVRRNAFPQIPRRIDGSGVVDSGSAVEGLRIAGASLIEAVGKTISTGGSSSYYQLASIIYGCQGLLFYLLPSLIIRSISALGQGFCTRLLSLQVPAPLWSCIRPGLRTP